MAQYIDKAAVVAKIEKIIADETESIKSFEHGRNISERQRSNARIGVLMYIRSFLDTLEVKECAKWQKDLSLTWKDVELLININEDINNEEAMTQVRSNKEHYEEVLKRFNDMFFH